MYGVVRFGRLAAVLMLAVWAVAGPARAGVVINEIHYHPDMKTEPAEFIELYNPGTNAVNLSGWQLSDAVTYSFPNGTWLAAGGYVVVAQDPATVFAKFGVGALGPWTGSLNNDGDKVVLLNATGGVEDEVDYQLGFPWPTVGDPPGYSIELANPAFDRNLGGNWRASVVSSAQSGPLIPDHSTWSYFKGLSEASSPTTAWRQLGFTATPWPQGAAPIGYDPAVTMGTRLDDMNGLYTSFFLLKTFVVDEPAQITSLKLEALYDDGFKLWINGTNLLNQSLPTNEVPYNAIATGQARESNAYDTFILDNPGRYLRRGTNVIAVQVHNILLSGSSDAFFDARLTATSGNGPTPGRQNVVFTTNLPPQIRQVDHNPNEPHSGEAVKITAKVTDPEGVRSVALQYQLVDPGGYLTLTDAGYTNNWTTVAMTDAGTNGDMQAGDSIYTVVLPGTLQMHRRLVRYRITAVDATGLSLTVPYPDDPQPNFAYFCYDGVPAWQAAVRPGSTPLLTFGTNVMRRLPAVHLISKRSDVESATWTSRYAGDAYLWSGTLVFDGKVYDHIHYRARGGGWRYAMVKNMWKFDLNRGHELEMRDDYGEKYKVKWTKLNLGACIQQGDYGHRGEQGMFESVGFRLFNLAEVEAPNTVFLQYRVIDDVAETTAGNQYEGDFWGLYLGVEQEDGRFLDEHGLPDGNFYKMEGGTGTLNNLGWMGPMDKSDLNSFLASYQSTSQPPSESWWRTNLALTNYWSYQAIVQGIHHYDICYDKNYFYYHNPVSGLWSVHSWDLDLTWANNMYDSGCGGIDDLYYPVFGGGSYPAKPAMTLEFRNRVREIRDLLLNTDQAWQLIDEHAGLLRDLTNSNPSFLEADRCQWDFNPKMTDSAYSSTVWKAGAGLFYQWPNEPTVSKTFEGCVQLMKNYVVTRGTVLDNLANDTGIPAQPSVTYLGPAGYALNRLTFRSSAYAGTYPFAAMKWRLGETTDTNAPAYDPKERRHYEITPVWESEQPTFSSDITIPAGVVKAGHAYRARVRMKDSTGRWSRWSTPVQFITGLPDTTAALLSNLRITELMYAPASGSDYEFIELHNTSDSLPLDLQGAKFTAGVDFTFSNGTTMPPGSYLLVVRATNQAAFRAHYALAPSVALAGPYSGSLANDGEQLTLKVSAGGPEICSFSYGGRGWPVAAQGAGHSLVPLERAVNGQATGALDYPGNWRASAFMGGSPGQADPESPAPTILLNEITAHTDYFDPLRPEYDSNDWIELYNSASTNVTLTGWYLSDDPAAPQKWAIPATTIPAHGWQVYDEVNGFHNPITTGFGLDKAGEQVLLSHVTGTAEDRVVDEVRFKGQENEVSLGRYPDGAAFWLPMLRTAATANKAGLTGVIVSEIMYHPPDLGTNDNTRDEYVELYNPTATPVLLQDTNGVWRLNGGIGFDFPANTTIPAGGTLLVANINPVDTGALAVFKSVYGLTNSAVPILGPYSGKLGNRSDRVALEKPQYPDLVGDPYSWVIVDEVIYGNQDPWPTNANGGAYALQRVSATASGNDPANWVAALPSPGAINLAPPDRDGDGMPDAWEIQHGFDPNDPRDAMLDSDGDGLSNLAEYLCGTDPWDPTSTLRFDSVDLVAGAVRLRLTAQAGRSYSIQYRGTLTAGRWERLTDIPAGPSTRSVEVSDSGSDSFGARFYRIVTPALP